MHDMDSAIKRCTESSWIRLRTKIHKNLDRDSTSGVPWISLGDLYQVIYLPVWELVALIVLSVSGTMRGNFEGINAVLSDTPLDSTKSE